MVRENRAWSGAHVVGDRHGEAPAGDIMLLSVGENGGLRSPLAGGSRVERVCSAWWPGWLLFV